MGTTENNNSTKFIALSAKGKKYEFDVRDDNAVKYKNKSIKAAIEEKDGFTFIVLNNKKYPIEIISANQNRYEVLINNVGYTFSIETPFSYIRKTILVDQVQSKTEMIEAPIPGKIIEIVVEENQMVREGDTLLILEAMKMQNEITSHVTGKIKKIMVKKNDSVMKDDVLIEIEK